MASHQTKYIAVVDDEEELVALFTEALKELEGYTILGFTDPKVAYEHFSVNKVNYLLILCDLRMPGLNEIELIKKSKLLNPSLVCLLMTAYDVGSD